MLLSEVLTVDFVLNDVIMWPSYLWSLEDAKLGICTV